MGAGDDARREEAVERLRAEGADAFGVALDVASDDARPRRRPDRPGDERARGGPRDERDAPAAAPVGLAETNVMVSAACPGYVATDFTGLSGSRTPDDGAAIAVRLATLPDDGPRGGFFDDAAVVPW